MGKKAKIKKAAEKAAKNVGEDVEMKGPFKRLRSFASGFFRHPLRNSLFAYGGYKGIRFVYDTINHAYEHRYDQEFHPGNNQDRIIHTQEDLSDVLPKTEPVSEQQEETSYPGNI